MSKKNYVIGIWTFKGGSGKTTLAINIAGEFHSRGLDVCVVDGDKQESAHHVYTDAAFPIYPAQESDKALNHDYIIIDHAPAKSGAEMAGGHSLLIVPIQPTMNDFHAAKIGLQSLKGETGFVVMNRYKSNVRDHNDFRQIFRDNFGEFETASELTAYQNAANQGVSVFQLSGFNGGTNASRAHGEMSYIAERALKILHGEIDQSLDVTVDERLKEIDINSSEQ